MSGSGVDGFLGAFTFFAIPWQASTVPPLPVLANFTCYAGGAGGSVVVFELSFPAGLPNASIAPPPAQGFYEAGGNALPSTRFPSFAAGPLDAVRNPVLRYVEYAGVMSSSVRRGLSRWGAGVTLLCSATPHKKKLPLPPRAHSLRQESSVGAGLRGYLGGQRSGPLVLLNSSGFVPGTTPPPSLVLGPADHFSAEILAVVPSQQGGAPAGLCGEAPVSGGCALPGAAPETQHVLLHVQIPNRDQTGASHSPGYDAGARVANTSVCCALCASLGFANCT